MKNEASPMASVAASAVRTANDNGRASTTRPSHALARASCDSTRKSDMRFLRFYRQGLRADRAPRHDEVAREQNCDRDQRRELQGPVSKVADRHVIGRQHPPGEPEGHE